MNRVKNAVRSAALLAVGAVGSLLVAACDLGVTNDTAAPDPATQGVQVTYGFIVSSDANGWSAGNVCVDVDLPAGTTYVSATSSVGSCTGTGPVTCTLGAFGVSESETVSVTIQTSGSTPLGSATATATARDCSTTLAGTQTLETSTGGDTSNNVASETVTVVAGACGNGVVDSGEDCEQSISGTDCCTSSCTFEPSITTCTDDGKACTIDHCDGAGSCVHEFPATYPGSVTPAFALKGSLQLKKNTDPAKDKLTWKWKNGIPMPYPFDLYGAPTAGAFEYSLCVGDANGLVLELKAPWGSNWTASASVPPKYKYKDKTLTPDGILSAQLKPDGGIAGKGQIVFKGKGTNLGMPALSFVPPVRARMLVTQGALDEGSAWDAVYSTPTKNDAAQFKAKND